MALNLTLLSDSLLSDLSTAVCHYIFVITVWIRESLMRENPTWEVGEQFFVALE